MVILKPIASNWSRSEREKLNNNWTIIENYLSNLQGQINLLTGDVNVQELIDQLNQLLSQSTLVLEELESALANIETIITNAQNATDDANNAAQSALNAVNDIQSMIDNFQTKGTFDMETIYAKNNSVLYEGSSYIYINVTPTKGNPPPNYPQIANDYWHMTAAKGASGEGAVSKVNGKEPNAEGEIILSPSDIGAASSTELETHSKEIATTEELGHIKPDGTTITVDPVTGVASAVSKGAGTILVPATSTDGEYYNVTLEDVTELTNGLAIRVQPNMTNLQGVKIIVNDMPFKYITYAADGLIQAGLFKANAIYTLVYNGAFFILQGDGFGLTDSLTSTSKHYAASANSVKTLNDLKANKQQEALLTPTGKNNWNVSASRYFKDEFGIVHLYFNASGGNIATGTVVLTLPVGYRPNPYISFAVNTSNSASTVFKACLVWVTPNGDIALMAPGDTLVQGYISFPTQ
ncbi:hypothetical protein ABC382_22690 [Lysinibacillus sp. 1P01SD]|uniref:hypothetical protein n=1 Tax=Lysinibacillus sp. 1P01SD TaxID=3132285 RepID=UPI0039A340BD